MAFSARVEESYDPPVQPLDENGQVCGLFPMRSNSVTAAHLVFVSIVDIGLGSYACPLRFCRRPCVCGIGLAVFRVADSTRCWSMATGCGVRVAARPRAWLWRY